MVKHLMFAYRVSERRACQLLKVNRAMHRYISHAWDQAYLMKRIREIASIRVRYSYRHIHILLKREGWQVNHKWIFRLYRREGLQMRLPPSKTSEN